jgi:hypothetical protein
VTLTIYILCICVIAAVAIIAAVWFRQREADLAFGWQPVDLRTMAQLLSKEDDKFLTANVPAFSLLKLRVLRALAADDYFTRLLSNSRYAVAVAVRDSQQSNELLQAATALRLEVTKLRVKSWLSVLSPIDVDTQRLGSLARPFLGSPRLSAVSTR